MTRRVRFLSLSALAAIILPMATALMSGCGGTSAIAESNYTGAYGGFWVTNGSSRDALADSGALTFSVDDHGNITGSIVNPYGSTAFVDGTVKNNGDFSGKITRQAGNGGPAVTYTFYGKYGPQQVDSTGIVQEVLFLNSQVAAAQADATPTPTPTPSASAGSQFKAGLAGDFRVTINGTDYAGQFQAVGGSVKNGG